MRPRRQGATDMKPVTQQRRVAASQCTVLPPATGAGAAATLVWAANSA